MIWIVCITSNAPKSYTMQEMHTRIISKIMHGIGIDKSEIRNLLINNKF